jgi:hypothetical protein
VKLRHEFHALDHPPTPPDDVDVYQVLKTQAFATRVAPKGIRVEPKMLTELEYRAKSAEGKVRHPF